MKRAINDESVCWCITALTDTLSLKLARIIPSLALSPFAGKIMISLRTLLSLSLARLLARIHREAHTHTGYLARDDSKRIHVSLRDTRKTAVIGKRRSLS